MTSPSPAVATFLSGIKAEETVVPLTWDDWLGVGAPYGETTFRVDEAQTRYHRNGYDWDIHGRIYRPAKEANPGLAFVMFHGGSGNEHNFDFTPDGRPCLARVLAGQGFTVLSLTYTGLYPPGGTWSKPATTRQPHYLLDRDLPEAEIADRNLKCTFNVLLQGSAQLTDEHLAGREILAMGYSTGGPMAVHLHRFVKKVKIKGLPGFGSGGPDGWRLQWRDMTGLEKEHARPLGLMARRTAEGLAARGYALDQELCPWGTLERYVELGEAKRSHISIGLCMSQHSADLGALQKHVETTGLPESEYFDHLQDPNPDWLKSISVLLLVGEKDQAHWVIGEGEQKTEHYMAKKYQAHGARSRVVTVPRYGHNGYCELYCEKWAYLWLWAYRDGYFG